MQKLIPQNKELGKRAKLYFAHYFFLIGLVGALIFFEIIDVSLISKIIKNPIALVCSLLAIITVILVTIVRWALLCNGLKIHPNCVTLGKLVCYSNIAATILPGGLISGDIVKTTVLYFMEDDQKSKIFSVTLFDRISSLVILLLTASFFCVLFIDRLLQIQPAELFLYNLFTITSISVLMVLLSVYFYDSALVLYLKKKVLKSPRLPSPQRLTKLVKFLSPAPSHIRILLSQKPTVLINFVCCFACYFANFLALYVLLVSLADAEQTIDGLSIFSAALNSWCISIAMFTPGAIAIGELTFGFFVETLLNNEKWLEIAASSFFIHRCFFLITSAVFLLILSFRKAKVFVR